MADPIVYLHSLRRRIFRGADVIGTRSTGANVLAFYPPIYFRQQQVKDRCGHVTRPPGHFRQLYRFPVSPYISFEPSKTFFCPLAKVGSTFFTRYFMSVRNAVHRIISPLNISIDNANRWKQLPFTALKSQEERFNFLEESTKIVFTRNPYSRVFSAYIDKLFSPNPQFWRRWGVNAIKLNQLPITRHPCGSFVSFRHFVKFVIMGGLWKRDVHIMPMDFLCRFCDVGYDVVGKLESITTDVDFLSAKLNVSSYFIHDAKFKNLFTEDAIKDSTKDPLSTWRKEITTCISDYDSGRIIWRKLQIRGFIDAGISFPFSHDEMASVSLENFRQECYKAVEMSTDTDRLKRQRIFALQEAYSTVSPEDIHVLQQIYERDFALLDYDSSRPARHVQQGDRKSAQALDWTIPWSL